MCEVFHTKTSDYKTIYLVHIWHYYTQKSIEIHRQIDLSLHHIMAAPIKAPYDSPQTALMRVQLILRIPLIIILKSKKLSESNLTIA